MERILVRGGKTDLYNELTSEYAIGDYAMLYSHLIIHTEDGSDNIVARRAKEYFDKYTEEDGNHRVYDILKMEEGKTIDELIEESKKRDEKIELEIALEIAKNIKKLAIPAPAENE